MADFTYQHTAIQAANQYGIPPSLFLSLINTESGWNANVRGAAGEIGLGQLMPSTAASLGVANPYDPVQNLYGAAKYLAQQYASTGSWAGAVVAYNRGLGGYRANPNPTTQYQGTYTVAQGLDQSGGYVAGGGSYLTVDAPSSFDYAAGDYGGGGDYPFAGGAGSSAASATVATGTGLPACAGFSAAFDYISGKCTFSKKPTDAEIGAANSQSSVAGALKGVGSFFDTLTSADLWQRIGLIGIGAIILLAAIFLFGFSQNFKVEVSP